MTIESCFRRLKLTSWWAIGLLAIAATAGGEDPALLMPASISLSEAEVARSLGPGPLPRWRLLTDRPEPRAKTAMIGEAIDQCVEDNMAQLDAPGAAVAVTLHADAAPGVRVVRMIPDERAAVRQLDPVAGEAEGTAVTPAAQARGVERHA